MIYIGRMLTLSILSRAIKQLTKLPVQDREALMRKLEAYAADRQTVVDVKQLKGVQGVFRLRHGNWRALFEVDAKKQTMVVVEVLDRKDAYK